MLLYPLRVADDDLHQVDVNLPATHGEGHQATNDAISTAGTTFGGLVGDIASTVIRTGAMHTFLVANREHPSRLDIDTHSTAASPEAPAPGEAASPFNDRRSFSSSSPYADGPPSASSPIEFESLVSMKPELFHLGTSGYGIDILCENIFYKDDVLFLLISLKNGSAVSYALSEPRFSVESKRRTKRGLQYEKAIFPMQSYGLGVVQPDATGKLVFTFDKVSLTRGQVLRIYFYEKGGARNYILTISARDINYAKMM